MTRPTPELIAALRATALSLQDGASYAWSRMGSCNCGHLAQTLTGLTSLAIQDLAHESAGDWKEQTEGFCGGTRMPLHRIFDAMLEAGMTTEDIMHLERLSSPVVLRRLGRSSVLLDYRSRTEVVQYMNAWADLLEEALLPQLSVPSELTSAPT
ncbi:MAG: hypothetical protein RhofKO_19120 [Rhodothermales bacterium]